MKLDSGVVAVVIKHEAVALYKFCLNQKIKVLTRFNRGNKKHNHIMISFYNTRRNIAVFFSS